MRFRRNALFNHSLKDINVDIGNKIAALEMTLSGEQMDFNANISNKQMSKASRGELQCIEGHRAYFGHGRKQNYQKAFQCYQKSADLKNADGMNHLAMMYEKGIGCIQNIDI